MREVFTAEKEDMNKKINLDDIRDAIYEEFSRGMPRGKDYVLLKAAIEITLKLLGELDEED